MNKKISFVSLVVLIIAAIDNMRNLPSVALFGSALIFFFTLSALLFLIPTALVAAELSSKFPEQGGIYQWVNRAFGKKWAMAAIWLQWINTMVWYPTMLSFIAGTLAYLINPELTFNKTYLITCVLIIFWGLTLINLKGIHVSALVNTVCCTCGTIVPLIALIVLGTVWVFTGHPLQLHLKTDQLIPPLTHTSSWISLIAIMASFLGIELSGVHVNEIQNPQKNFPRAVLLATLFIFLSMGLGSLFIAFVLPGQEISLIAGVMQVFDNFFRAFGLSACTPILTFLIVFGSIGTMINWLISPAKGLLHAAEYGFLPSFFSQKNKAGVAVNILLAQAILVTLLCLFFLFSPSINAFYWFLTALSTELYMLMYILMFAACIRIHYKQPHKQNGFAIPGGIVGKWAIAAIGLIGCLLTILVSFFPPDTIHIENPLRYLLMICIGNVVTITPLVFFYRYHKKSQTSLAT